MRILFLVLALGLLGCTPGSSARDVEAAQCLFRPTVATCLQEVRALPYCSSSECKGEKVLALAACLHECLEVPPGPIGEAGAGP